VILHEFVI